MTTSKLHLLPAPTFSWLGVNGSEIEMQDDEGHMGTATTKMSSYRKTATASPSYTDRTRYKEGWEDIWYLLLYHLFSQM